MHPAARRLLTAIDALPAEEVYKEGLRARFGLSDGEPRLLQEVVAQFGLEPEMMKKLERQVLRQLRDPQ